MIENVYVFWISSALNKIGPPGHPQLLTSLPRLVTDSARVLPYWVEEAGGEGKAAGVEEAGPGRGCPFPVQVGDGVEHELRKVRKTFDEKV